MTEKKLRILINMSIDGMTTPREEAKLRAILEHDANAKRLHEDLSRLVAVLRESTSDEAPAELKQRILDKLPAVKEPQLWRTNPLERLRFFHISRYRTAYAFAGGCALGVAVCLFVLLQPGVEQRVDPMRMTGSLIDRSGPESSQSVRHTTFSAGGFHGGLTVRTSGSVVTAGFEGTLVNGSALTVRYPSGTLELTGYSRDAGDGASVDQSTGTVTVSYNGDGKFSLYFLRHGEAPVRLVVGSTGPSSGTQEVDIPGNQ